NWVGGWSNQVTYKNFTLTGLLDFHVGGSLWSITNWFGDYAGVLKSSLNGREVDWNKPGLVVKGIDINTCPSYSDAVSKGICPGGKQNTKTITAEEYYQNIFPVNEGYVYKATYVKLRELRFGYDLPTRWANRFSASSMNLAFTSLNLNPNNPEDVPATTIFTPAERNAVGRWLGGGIADLRGTEWLVQHLAEVQYPDEDDYKRLQASSTSGLFDGPYQVELEDLQKVIVKGVAAKDAGSYAPAQILRTWGYEYLTDTFGDIPYSQALKGDSVGST